MASISARSLAAYFRYSVVLLTNRWNSTFIFLSKVNTFALLVVKRCNTNKKSTLFKKMGIKNSYVLSLTAKSFFLTTYHVNVEDIFLSNHVELI